MPGAKKHSEKFDRCVAEVKGKGHPESSAYAICTTSFQNSGQEVYAEARVLEALPVHDGVERHLHLLGAFGGPVRYETLNGKKHLVVPIVALMEGVIHPVNADTPEFVSEAVLAAAAASWVGRPVTLGHPKRGGTQCSADDPEVRLAHGLGVIMKSEMSGKKMLQEAWLEEEKTKKLHPVMYERLASGQTEEVSVGAFVTAKSIESSHNGKAYKAAWLTAQGDHLAMLPGGRGACSCDMGCGTNRHLVAAESIELMPELPVLVYTALSENLDERINKVNQAVYEKWKNNQNLTMAQPMSTGAYPIQVFDDKVIVRRGDETLAVNYTIDKNGDVILSDAVKVKQQWVEAARKECPTCHGLGQVGSKDCETCDGDGYIKMKANAGARHSSSDMKMLQTMHDHSVALGAKCPEHKAAEAQEDKRVKRVGTEWCLYTKDGSRVLATYKAEKDALDHEEAIKTYEKKKCG